MDVKQWLTGWKAIGKHIGKSAKTAQRYARKGMPFFRDPGGRPVSLPWQLNEWLVEMNQDHYDDKTWTDRGIRIALLYEDDKAKDEREFKERLIEAQRPVRSRF